MHPRFRGLIDLLGLLLLFLPCIVMAMDCPNDMAPTIAGLRECVQHAYDMGHIYDARVERVLLGEIDAAQAAVDHGQIGKAVSTLILFIAEVNVLAGRQIDAECASHMAMHARAVIDALSP